MTFVALEKPQRFANLLRVDVLLDSRDPMFSDLVPLESFLKVLEGNIRIA